MVGRFDSFVLRREMMLGVASALLMRAVPARATGSRDIELTAATAQAAITPAGGPRIGAWAYNRVRPRPLIRLRPGAAAPSTAGHRFSWDPTEHGPRLRLTTALDRPP